MRRSFQTLFILGVFTLLSSSSCNDFNNELTFHKHMITRGGWQWVITHDQDSFLAKNLPDSLQVDGKKSTLHYKLTGQMDTLYQVGPVDFPIFFRALPQIEIIH